MVKRLTLPKTEKTLPGEKTGVSDTCLINIE